MEYPGCSSCRWLWSVGIEREEPDFFGKLCMRVSIHHDLDLQLCHRREYVLQVLEILFQVFQQRFRGCPLHERLIFHYFTLMIRTPLQQKLSAAGFLSVDTSPSPMYTAGPTSRGGQGTIA